MAFRILFEPDAVDHLRLLTARDRRLVVDRVEAMLATDPDIETRNRKRPRPNPLAPWELRIGDLRVFTDVDVVSLEVRVAAIGRKTGSRLAIGGREVKL